MPTPARIPACPKQGTSYLPPGNRQPATANWQTRQPCRPPSKLPIPPEGPPQFCILHFDLCIFRYKCRISSTNRPLFVQTNPISEKPKITATPFSQTTYDNMPTFALPKANPKRTQTNPNEPKANPISQEPKNHRNFFHGKGLRQSDPLRPPKNKPKTNPKRTQTNPNEPKANPIFGPSGAPKAKTNPNKPKANPTCRGELVRLRRSLLAAAKPEQTQSCPPFTRRLPAVRLAGLSGGPADSKAKESCCGFACDISQRLSAGQPADLRC
jgi:hypothetical protein